MNFPSFNAFVCRAVFTLCAAFLFFHQTARAEDETADRVRSAADEFDKARHLALQNEDAASYFENAFHDAPSPEALRGAIRARLMSKHYARASTLSVLALKRYASEDSLVSVANETLSEAKPKLYEISMKCSPACGITADGKVVGFQDELDTRFYLEPGEHSILISWPGDRKKDLSISASPGQSVVFEEVAPSLNTPSPLKHETTVHPVVTKKKPFAPVVFWVSLSATALVGAAAVGSGIWALNDPGKEAVIRDCTGQTVSCPTYQRGKEAELRTNILIGAAGGLALATAVIGVFLTDFSGSPSVGTSKEEQVKKSNENPTKSSQIKVHPTLSIGDGQSAVGIFGSF